MPRGVSDLSFTRDGAHYSYLLYESLDDIHLVVDGVLQPQSVVSKERVDTSNASALKYVVSPDGRHFAHFANSASPSVPGRGVFLDGKFIATALEGNNTQLAFSPDSKHLLWIHQYAGNRPLRVFVDGKPVADFSSPTALGAVANWWDLNSDGTLSFLANHENSLKRVTVTPWSETSIETLVGNSSVAAKGN